MTIQISTSSIDETQRLGQTVGNLLQERILLAFSGELGSGKTTFIQGLAKGIGVPEDCYVTSPTYTLINEYPGRIPLFHVDLYRINDPEELDDIGLADIIAEHGVTAIEWAEKYPHNLPKRRIDIHMEITSSQKRLLRMTAYGQRERHIISQIKERMKETT